MEALEVSGYPDTSGPGRVCPSGPPGPPGWMESLQLRSQGWVTNQTEGGFILLLLPSVAAA